MDEDTEFMASIVIGFVGTVAVLGIGYLFAGALGGNGWAGAFARLGVIIVPLVFAQICPKQAAALGGGIVAAVGFGICAIATWPVFG